MITDLVAGGPFASQMITGASVAARSADHVILIGESQGDVELEELLITEMLDRLVDGLVYAKVVTAEIDVPEVLRNQRAVLLNCVDRSGTPPAGRARRVRRRPDRGRRPARRRHPRRDPRRRRARRLAARWPAPLRYDGIRDALRAAGSDVGLGDHLRVVGA